MLEEIKRDFDKVISYSQGIKNPQTDKLFEVWAECKKDFIRVFGDKYIYELPGQVSFHLSEKEKHNRVDRFVDQLVNYWDCTALSTFILAQEKGFFDNLTVQDYTTPRGKVIKKGTKLVRAFKYFVDSERALVDIQNAASRIIQEDRIEGTLCLSVHPLDYLSVSENTYKWRSCHALDGDFRAGNLSYMMDKSTLVCYLKGEDDVVLPNFPEDVKWNNKKWRVLLYVSNDWNMIFAGRQYPFEASSGMDIVLQDLLSKVKICREGFYDHDEGPYWTPWTGTMIGSAEFNESLKIEYTSPFVPVGETLIELQDIIKDGDCSCHFNDVLHSSCYKPIYTVKYRKNPWYGKDEIFLETDKETHFYIGGNTYCLECGENMCLNEGDGTMRCEKCEFEFGQSDNDRFTYCDCCDSRVYVDSTIYIDSDTSVCQHCFDKYYRVCENCGEAHHIDYIHFDNENEIYICNSCLVDREYDDDEE